MEEYYQEILAMFDEPSFMGFRHEIATNENNSVCIKFNRVFQYEVRIAQHNNGTVQWVLAMPGLNPKVIGGGKIFISEDQLIDFLYDLTELLSDFE